MRIPYIINKNTKVEYTPSKATVDLVGETGRKIISENFNWDDELCPSLATLCVQAICKSFKDFPRLDLPCPDRNYLLEILPTDLPLELTVPLIEVSVLIT